MKKVSRSALGSVLNKNKAALLAYDRFNRAAGAIGTADKGGAWTNYVSSIWSITGSQAYMSVDPGFAGHVGLTTGYSDCYVSADIYLPPSGTMKGGIELRRSGSDWLGVSVGGDGAAIFLEQRLGTYAILQTVGVTWVSGDTLTVWVLGDRIRAYQNDVLRLDYTGITMLNGGVQGLYVGTGATSTSWRFDNFLVYNKPAAGDMETVRFLISSDQHYCAVGDPAYEAMYANSITNFTRWAEIANEYYKSVTLGDQNIEAVRLDNIYTLLATIKNCYNVIGNHQFQGTVGEAERIARLAAVVAGFNIPGAYYSYDLNNWHIIVLNACYNVDDTPMGVFTGHISAAEFTWLDNELLSSKAGVLALMHHSPITGSVAEGSWFTAADMTTLQTKLNSRSNVFVISGHTHPASITKTLLGTVPVYQIPALYVAGKYAEVVLQYRALDNRVKFGLRELTL